MKALRTRRALEETQLTDAIRRYSQRAPHAGWKLSATGLFFGKTDVSRFGKDA
jgi:hypothetical protein